jgi:hypothetical protein
LHEEIFVAEEPSPGGPSRRLTSDEVQVLLNAAEAICERRGLTPHDMSVLSAAWSFLAFRELAVCKGRFYELICGVEHRTN